MTKRNRNETDGENATTTTIVTAAAADGVYLPPELIPNILSRLPVKSIGRFRCVCKNWQTLLCDPQFLKIQFELNRLQTNKVILPLIDYFMAIDFHKDGDNNGGEPVKIYETLNCIPPYIPFSVEGSYNGLLLLIANGNKWIWIVNPYTRESWKLPTLSTTLDEVYLSHPAFGFGYCSCDDAYTVVVVSDYHVKRPVYMWNKRNGWKRVENSPTEFKEDSSCCGYFVNGAIHWIGFIPPGGDEGIYAFDLAGERFVRVDTPEGLKQQQKEGEFHLAVLGGCLCLLVERKYGRTDMWVMKEYRVRKSWTKYCISTRQEYSFFKPLFFWGSDEFVIGNDGLRLTLCSLNRENLTEIGNEYSETHDRGIWTFSDSLFSPTGFNGQIRRE